MTIKDALKEANEKLQTNGSPSSRLDAELILAKLLGKTREWLIAHDDEKLSTAHAETFEELIKRRLGHEPVGYINNSVEFYGIDFFIDNRVLSPRGETEAIVEEVIARAPKNAELIDIGTGSGAIAIAIAKHRPDLKITATEVSEEALEVAQLNTKKLLGKDHNIRFVMSDIWDDIKEKFDVVVTNLPYVSESYKPNMKPEVLKEPAVALFGGRKDGLDLYRKFYQGLPKHIKPGSLVYHESDPWQHDELKKLAKTAGLKPAFENYLILGFVN
jgi:release factor glutamine methyltransferase